MITPVDNAEFVDWDGNPISRDEIADQLGKHGLKQELVDANKGVILRALFSHCENRDDWMKLSGKYKEALANIAKKDPHLVSRAEAADMACEFQMLAEDALKTGPS